MRHTLLATLEYPPHTGGVAHYYASLTQHLPADRIAVLTPPQADAQTYDQHAAYPIIRRQLLSSAPWLWPRWLTALGTLRTVVKERRIERLLVGQILPLGTVAMLLHRQIGLPYTVIVHGMDITMPKGRRALLLCRILSGAKLVIANSRFTRDVAVKRGAHAQTTHVVHPGPHAWIKPDSSEVAALDGRYQLTGKPVILTVARLVERKGIDTLLAALVRLAQPLSEVRLVVVGEGPDRARLQSIVRSAKLADRVVFTGKQSAEALAAWYERCEVFALTPRQLPDGDVEGFGLVYLEANQFGKPVVGSRSGGVPEAVEDKVNGLLVAPNDPGATAQAIYDLLRHPQFAQRLGMQGLDRVHREFDWHKIGQTVAALLNES